MDKILFSSKRMDWETPQGLFNELDNEFHFTLDPCATAKTAKCSRYFTKEQDGLKQSWEGQTVFCNPPYGRELPKWIEKCYNESANATVVMLIPARTDTKAFHKYIYNKSEIRFIKGRVRFLIDGEPGDSAPFPSMIVIFKRNKQLNGGKLEYFLQDMNQRRQAGVLTNEKICAII